MPDWLIQLLISGVSSFVGVRVALAVLHVKVEHAQRAADTAHQRIDALMQRHVCN